MHFKNTYLEEQPFGPTWQCLKAGHQRLLVTPNYIKAFTAISWTECNVHIEPEFEIFLNGEMLDVRFSGLHSSFTRVLIQTSKLFWRSESLAISALGETEQERYHNNFGYSLNGPLTPQNEAAKNRGNFINTVLAIGYLLHKYKPVSLVGAVGVFDSDQNARNFNTGKSLLLDAVGMMVPVLHVDGRNRLNKNEFLYSSLTHDAVSVINYDSLNGKDMGTVVMGATHELTVKSPGKQDHTIPYSESPKTCFSAGIYPAAQPEISSAAFMRRLWSVLVSDYVPHGADSDFTFQKTMNNRSFADFTAKDLKDFYMVMALCLHYYLKFGRNGNPCL